MTRLIVFSDDWGRHPSSCQHLIRALLNRFPVTWVNTIGMRRPALSRGDLAKITQRLRRWVGPRGLDRDASLPANLTVLTPLMWPGFHRGWERALNAALVGRTLRRAHAASPNGGAERRVLLTTLPITAALLDRLRVDAAVYYCVDDVASWPGLDGRLMRELEQRLVRRVDRIVAASRVLQGTLATSGRDVALLTHGVDLALWQRSGGTDAGALPAWAHGLRRPVAVFWGLIDRRLDVEWLRALQDPRLGTGGSLVLAGPHQAYDPAIAALDGVVLPGPVPYDDLPRLAALADILVMPYGDSPATRAMQPLKLKEYLATCKPVIARDLPALRAWTDAADIVDRADVFARTAAQRAQTGTPQAQLQARRRVLDESWERKADELEALLAAYL